LIVTGVQTCALPISPESPTERIGLSGGTSRFVHLPVHSAPCYWRAMNDTLDGAGPSVWLPGALCAFVAVAGYHCIIYWMTGQRRSEERRVGEGWRAW